MEEAGISPSDLDLAGNFDDQVINILENVRLSREEVNSLQLLHDHLAAALQRKWPDCKVLLFGSIATGLGMKTSDVDCFIEVHPYILHHGGAKLVSLARNVLRQQPHLFRKLLAITRARVPIVKFCHIPTEMNCDINFTSPSGVRNSELLLFFLNCDNSYLTLAVLIKYWAKVHKLTGTNLVSSYGLSLMLIFYLQQLHLLPPVRHLQEGCRAVMVGNWNTSFISRKNVPSCDRSLYHLMGGFFKFYSTFDFDNNIISPYAGSVIARKVFGSLDSVPSIFRTYKRNVSRRICLPIQLDTKCCLQDPFEHNSNVMRGVYPRLAFTFLAHFRLAAKLYDENNADQFLTDVLTKQPPIRGKQKIQNENNTKPTYVQNTGRVMRGKINKLTQRVKNKNQYSLTAIYQQMKNQRQNCTKYL